MKRKDEPIVTSFFDIDYYKETMAQISHSEPLVHAVFGWQNRRLSIPVANYVDIGALREQIDHLGTLRPTRKELKQLADIRFPSNTKNNVFRKSYIDFLKHFPNKLISYNIEQLGKQFFIEFHGPDHVVTRRETQLLSIISELYSRAVLKELGISIEEAIKIGMARHNEKCDLLLKHPKVTLTDFGGRRRALRKLHESIVENSIKRLGKQFAGTSNVHFAFKYGVNPIGTIAHQAPMKTAALANSNEELRQSPIKVMDTHWKWYGYDYSIFLPDTFGSRTFFNDFGAERLAKWKGPRQDSQEPISYGEEIVMPAYRKYGINPQTKLMVCSDGMTVDTMIDATGYFLGNMLISHGIGTDWTNDISVNGKRIITPIPMVSKLIRVGHSLNDMRPTVKLSDNLEKSMGPETEKQRYVRVFDYNSKRAEKIKF